MNKTLITIRKSIEKTGNNLVNCKRNCEGITNNPDSGIIPRCLYLEEGNGIIKQGCVIVGINPGQSDDEEQQEYKKQGDKYKIIRNYWKNPGERKRGTKHPYYSNSRLFAQKAGFKGPILWTELVKCENKIKGELPPLQTFRTCINKFLFNEIDTMPDKWPIICLGRKAHEIVSYSFPERSVLGIPHPTGSKGNFWKLFNEGQQTLKKDIEDQIIKLSSSPTETLWLK